MTIPSPSLTQRRTSWSTLATALLVLALVGALAGWVVGNVQGPTTPVGAPRQEGGSDSSASSSATADPGTSTDPASSASAGGHIGGDGSGGGNGTGGNCVTLPNVHGATYESAKQDLEYAGYRVTRRDESSQEHHAGTVIRTDPARCASRGSTVTVYVATASGKITVPNVIGMDCDDAGDAISAAGLDDSLVYGYKAGAAPGTVYSQDPSGGSKVDRNSVVTITCARAPAPTPAPTG